MEIIMKPLLSSDITVKELLERHPELLSTFVKQGLLCVGCPAEAFHSVKEVAREYGLDQDQLLKQFQNVIDNSNAS